MAGLVLLVPSRGRPHNVARLLDACAGTCQAETIVHFGFDEDDPRLLENVAAAEGLTEISVRPRMGLAAWTNELAAAHPDAEWLCSIGDDMVPVTEGWDKQLCDAAAPGIAYPNDKRRDDIPECAVISRSIVDALGWYCEPTLEHWFIDSVWADLGRLAGCLSYLPEVIVEHRHPNVPGGDPHDATYQDAAAGFAADMAAYQKWRMRRMRQDVAKVRECLKTRS